MRGDVELNTAYVTIYDKTGERCYAFYNTRASDENNALKEYEMHGGENDPFEYVKLSIPRKKMSQIAPDLMEPNAIVSGVNKIFINAMGKGLYVVASSDLTGDTCTITAYCQAYKLTSTILTENLSGYPLAIIRNIITSGAYGDFIGGDLKYWCIEKGEATDVLEFNAGVTLWYVLQVCAMYLGCRIFFTGDDAFLVDYRLSVDTTDISFNPATGIGTVNGIDGFVCSGEPVINQDGTRADDEYLPNAVYDFGDIDLFTADSTRPEYGRVVNEVKLGNEGLTTVINKVNLSCADSVTVVIESAKAIRQYDNTVMAKELTIPSLKETNMGKYKAGMNVFHQGLTAASNIIDYRCESQQSIQFTFKEYVHTSGEIHWVPFFPPSARVRSISDSLNDVNISNTSTLNPSIVKPQKLILSSYVRTFPEGTSTYKFGVISSIDLSTKLNEMTTAQNTQ